MILFIEPLLHKAHTGHMLCIQRAAYFCFWSFFIIIRKKKNLPRKPYRYYNEMVLKGPYFDSHHHCVPASKFIQIACPAKFSFFPDCKNKTKTKVNLIKYYQVTISVNYKQMFPDLEKTSLFCRILS